MNRTVFTIISSLHKQE